MEPPKRDGSMHIRAALGEELISRETAVAICWRVLADKLGHEKSQAQQPLVVEDGANVWIVRGAIKLKPDAILGDPAPVQMSISKFDGAIVSFFSELSSLSEKRR